MVSFLLMLCYYISGIFMIYTVLSPSIQNYWCMWLYFKLEENLQASKVSFMFAYIHLHQFFSMLHINLSWKILSFPFNLFILFINFVKKQSMVSNSQSCVSLGNILIESFHCEWKLLWIGKFCLAISFFTYCEDAIYCLQFPETLIKDWC